MKKFLLLSLIFALFGNISYGYEVKYNSAGGVVSNTPVRFGENAIFTQRNAEIMAERDRQRRYADQYYNSLVNGKNINVNINHNGQNPRYYPNYNPPRYIYNHGYPSRTPFVNNRRLYNSNGININNRGFYIY